jgi:hypothetical protein
VDQPTKRMIGRKRKGQGGTAVKKEDKPSKKEGRLNVKKDQLKNKEDQLENK